MPKNQILVDLLQEVRAEQKEQTIVLGDLKIDVSQNTKDLTEHKEGVILERKKNAEQDLRLDKIEEPRIVFKFLKKYIIGAGAIAAAVYAILRAFGKV